MKRREAPPGGAVSICLLYGDDPFSKDPFAEDILLGMHERLFGQRVSVYAASLLPGQDIESLFSPELPEGMRGGVVFAGGLLEPSIASFFKSRSIPLVSVGRPKEGLEVPFVDADHFSGGYMAAEALIKRGRRKIAILDLLVPHIPSYEARMRGMVKALSDAGLDWDDGLCFNYGGLLASGLEPCMEAMRAKAGSFDGLIVYGGEAFGKAMACLSSAGVKVPEDVSIVGCMGYGLLYARLDFQPSAIMQPLREMGAAAAGMLLAGEPSQEPMIFPPFFTRGQTL